MKNNCPHCNRINSFKNQSVGAMVNCPDCKNLFILKDDELVSASCPDCENSVSPGDRICLSCGFNFNTGRKVEEHVPVYGEDFSWFRKTLNVVADFMPGLFRIHIFLMFVLCTAIALLLVYFGLVLLGFGGLVACVSLGVGALILYGHGVGFLLTGDLQLLNSAMVELTGARWTFFLIMVFGIPISTFIIIFKLASEAVK